MAQFEFKLPDIGEGVVEGEIVKWLVKAGDDVIEDQPLVEVMTDKATVTIPSPRRGKVVRTVGSEGEVAKVHAVLVVFESAGAGGASAAPAEKSTPSDKKSTPADKEPAQAPSAQAPSAQAAPPVASSGNGAHGEQAPAEGARKVLATPVTRKMARELGVDLAQLSGSGENGRVMKADVLAHVESQSPKSAPSPAAKAPAAPPPSEGDREVPLRGLRKSIAKSMVQSHSHVVPFTFVEECDTGALTSLRARVNAQLAKSGQPKLSYLPFIAKALLWGFRKYPDLNAVMDEEKQTLRVKKQVNVGFGAATDAGLTVFVVHDLEHKSIRAIGAEIERLAKAAREQKLQLHDLQGGTFTITSLGKDGGLMATPVVKHPEVAILGVHKIKEQPTVSRLPDGKLELGVAERMNLSCSFDHRVIDGHIGAAFLYEVIRALETPELLLID
jgi:pyruvate dehydrogenase E2 component (dihydrolipoamide acetyltransferase)